MQFYLAPIENFPNATMAVIFTVVFLLFLIIELRIYTKQRLTSGKIHDKLVSVLFLFTALFAICFSFVLVYSGLGRGPTNLSYLGLVLAILGFTIRQSAIITLGKYFTPVVTKQKKQKIIQVGVYKYIRHPSYTGLILEVLAVGLLMSNLFSLIPAFALLFSVTEIRIKIEEKFLIKEFGQEYKNYIQNTKKLIPFIY